MIESEKERDRVTERQRDREREVREGIRGEMSVRDIGKKVRIESKWGSDAEEMYKGELSKNCKRVVRLK